MKLVRHGQQGSERPGILDASGAIRDLSGKCQDFDHVYSLLRTESPPYVTWTWKRFRKLQLEAG
jgi:hypothetical protein